MFEPVQNKCTENLQRYNSLHNGSEYVVILCSSLSLTCANKNMNLYFVPNSFIISRRRKHFPGNFNAYIITKASKRNTRRSFKGCGQTFKVYKLTFVHALVTIHMFMHYNTIMCNLIVYIRIKISQDSSCNSYKYIFDYLIQAVFKS